ncbi:MAG: acyl-CoA dehydrogenase family protein [Thermodesulfobacteriota bacterium]|nr:acyl-CoA dehydrogenase family protein [Thermodesulfobacteriota bacterium]
MEFGLNQEQTILKNETRRFLKNECPIDFVKEMIEDEKGHSPPLWKKMAELGWMGLLFEEKYGGIGGTFLDLSIILEEMGRALLPGPFFSTVILGGVPITQGGDEELKQRFLPGIAKGDIIMTMALTEMEGSYAIDEIKSIGEPRSDGYVLRGRKMFVPYAHIADYIICPARTYQQGHSNGISLFIVDAKSETMNIIPLISLDLQKQFDVTFTDVYVPQNNLIGEEKQGGKLIQNVWPIAVVGRCCEMLGAMQRVFEMTVDYAQKRRQFGRPLSAFQVIQHYCADMAIDLECSKVITHQAVWRVSNGHPSTKEVAMAKAWSSDAFKKIATTAHQIYGAIGFTKDQDLYLYFRFAKAGEITFGDTNFHKEVVAREMDLQGVKALR